MKIVLYAAALPGLPPSEVATRVVSAWQNKRPADSFTVALMADGDMVSHVGTGVSDVVRHHHPEAIAIEYGGQPGETAGRRQSWHYPGGALEDLAESHRWTGGEARGSTEFLAHDVLAMLEAGARHIHIHLPQFIRLTDYGIGFLSGLSGVPLDFSNVAKVPVITQALNQARDRLGATISVTYPYELRLSGIDGMARQLASHGYDAKRAQDIEGLGAHWLQALSQASQHTARKSLLAAPRADGRTIHSGAGGGLGMMFDLLGFPVHLIGDYVLAEYGGHDYSADLVFYVTNKVGATMPSGLVSATDFAADMAIPAILLTDSSGLNRGELPKLGLHGSYELRPEQAFLDENAADSVQAAAAVPGLLSESVARIAQTWGW